MIFVFQIQQHCHCHQHILLKIYIKKMGHLKIHIKKFRLWRSLFFAKLRQSVRRLKWATIWNLVEWKLWDRNGKSLCQMGCIIWDCKKNEKGMVLGVETLKMSMNGIEWINMLHINLLWKIVELNLMNIYFNKKINQIFLIFFSACHVRWNDWATWHYVSFNFFWMVGS